MPYDSSGTFTPVDGAENAFPGKVIASATWNAIFTDISAALTLLGQLILTVGTVKTTAGPFTITTETFVILNKGSPSATAITLPLVASRNNQALRVVDWAGNAGDITFTPHAGETIGGVATWVVASSGGLGLGGSILLQPNSSLSGWVVLP